MPRIFVCSPLRGDGTPAAYARNMVLARGYCRQVLDVGCVPVAGHLFYPQFVDDTVEIERALGIALGQLDMATCHELWHWNGDAAEASSGMRSDMDNAARLGLSIFDGAYRVAQLRAEIERGMGPAARGASHIAHPRPIRVVEARALRGLFR